MREGEINALSEICPLLIDQEGRAKCVLNSSFCLFTHLGCFQTWFDSEFPLCVTFFTFSSRCGFSGLLYFPGAALWTCPWCPAVPTSPGPHLSLSPQPPCAPAHTRGWEARQDLALGGSELSFAFVKHNFCPAPPLLPPNQMKYLLGWSVRAQCFVCRGTGESWF